MQGYDKRGVLTVLNVQVFEGRNHVVNFLVVDGGYATDETVVFISRRLNGDGRAGNRVRDRRGLSRRVGKVLWLDGARGGGLSLRNWRKR